MARRMLLALSISAALAAGLWTGGLYRTSAVPGGRQAEPPPVLVIDPHSLDLGEVWEGKAFTHPIRVENRGPEVVRVEGASCGCTGLTAEPNQFELAPGASRDVPVTIDLGGLAQTGPQPRAFSAPLRLRYTTPGESEPRQAAGELRGSVKPVVLTPADWTLGVYSKSSGAIEKRYEAVAAAPLAALDVETQPNPWGLHASVKPRPDRVGVYDVLVRAPAPRDSGPIRAEIVFRPTAANGTPLPPKHVTVEAEVAASDVRTDPGELCFGGTRVGTAAESRVTVTAISGQAVTVERAEPVGEGLEVVPGASRNEYRVTQRVTRPGAANGVVRFSVRTETGVERIELKVEATGVEPGAP